MEDSWKVLKNCRLISFCGKEGIENVSLNFLGNARPIIQKEKDGFSLFFQNQSQQPQKIFSRLKFFSFFKSRDHGLKTVTQDI